MATRTAIGASPKRKRCSPSLSPPPQWGAAMASPSPLPAFGRGGLATPFTPRARRASAPGAHDATPLRPRGLAPMRAFPVEAAAATPRLAFGGDGPKSPFAVVSPPALSPADSVATPTVLDDDATADLSDLGAAASAADVSGSSSLDGSFGARLSKLPQPDQSAFSATWQKQATPARSCPPTPVRTPSWAHAPPGPAPLVRKSSLCVSKVLLTLPTFAGYGDEAEPDFGGIEAIHEEDSDPEEEHGGAGGGGGGHGLGLGQPEGVEKHQQQQQPHSRSPQRPQQPQQQVTFADEFDVLGRLGAGEFSEVFRVLSLSDGRLYAVKRSKRQFRSRRDREIALAEVRAFQRLAGAPCPNVMQYYRAWQEDGYCFTQAELCERGSLRALLDTLRPAQLVPERTIWSFVADLCTGLGHVHASGLVHLDIKPQNVFIADDTHLKIGDFGMATEEGNADDGHEGDNAYMAKELLNAAAKHASADMFSLGIMLFEICSRAPLPLEGEPWHDLRDGRAPSLSPVYSLELRQLVRNLMDPVPATRPTAAQVLAMPSAAYDPHDIFVAQHTRAPTPPTVPRRLLAGSGSPLLDERDLHTPTEVRGMW